MSTKKRSKRAAAPKRSETTPKAVREKKTKAKAANNAQANKLSALDAAAQVLAASKEPMKAKQLIETMAAKGLWASPGGKTPQATLVSAIAREIATKGRLSRFKKPDRGKFTLA